MAILGTSYTEPKAIRMWNARQEKAARLAWEAGARARREEVERMARLEMQRAAALKRERDIREDRYGPSLPVDGMA